MHYHGSSHHLLYLYVLFIYFLILCIHILRDLSVTFISLSLIFQIFWQIVLYEEIFHYSFSKKKKLLLYVAVF